MIPVENNENILYIPEDNGNEKSVYHTFVIRVKKRDALKKYLEQMRKVI